MFAIYLLIYLILFIFYEQKKYIFDCRHYVLFFVTFVSGLSILLMYGKNGYKKIKYKDNYQYVIFTALFFLIYSFIKCIYIESNFNFRTVVQISLFLIPTIYAMNIVNILSDKELLKLMKLSTIIFICMYFTEPRHNLFQFFNINNWLDVDFLSFYGFNESHICAESFLQLFLFFFYIYYFVEKKDTKEYKNIGLFMIANAIFTILSFKRLSILFIFLLWIFKNKISFSKEIKKSDILIALLFVILTVYYTKLLTGEVHSFIDINKFSTNRAWILSLWSEKNYFSYGYGTSLYVIGRYLEMDLIQIYLEIGVVSLFIFCFSYFKLCKKRAYSNVIMLYVMFNLLTSSTMPWSTGWVFLLINIFAFSNDKYDLNQRKGEKFWKIL